MASRLFQQFRGTLEKGVIDLFFRVSVAGAGAVTLQTWNPFTRTYATAPTGGSQGIKSVVRTSTGAWTVTLQDSYQRLIRAGWTCTNTTGAMTVVAMGVLSTGDVTATTPTVLLLFSSAASTAADPASGDKIDIQLKLQNSAAK